MRIDWRGYELYPEHMYWPDYPVREHPANKPSTPGRLELMLAAEGVEIPHIERPHKMRSHNAHEAVEYAKTEGTADALVEALYRALWERGEEINNPQVILKIATGIVHDLDALADAIRTKRFKSRIVEFDDDAHENGVYNVPTYFVGGERLAEQPYGVVRKAVEKAKAEFGGTDAYSYLEFPKSSKDRPYVFINMVSTIDGKILSGGRGDHVADLGSKVDHLLMKRIEGAADAVMVGAQTLRATPEIWNPKSPRRVVVTRSGKIPHDHCFLLGGEAYIATNGSSMFKVPHGAKLLRAGNQTVDFELLLNRLKGLGVNRLLVMGGSDLNGQLLRAGLVDELFLTIAPKVKLGDDVPTYAGGPALDRHALLNFSLAESHVVGDEVFLRYRKK